MSGRIVFEEPTDLQRARVRVALVDTTLADAAARTIAEEAFEVSDKEVRELDFRLRLPDALPKKGLRLQADVSASGERLQRGDWRNVVAVPWSGETRGIVVTVRRI